MKSKENLDKFKQLVHFIISECDTPDVLGTVRLNKVIWFCDVVAFQTQGMPVTDESYVRRERGPVPKRILKALEELEAENKITINEPQYLYDVRKFKSVSEERFSLLSDENKSLARHVLSVLIGHSASKISEATHDIVWESAADGEEIPLSATLVSNRGEVTQDVLDWANKKIVA